MNQVSQSDDEDLDLIKELERWARGKDDVEKDVKPVQNSKNRPHPTNPVSSPSLAKSQPYSLHITKLPTDADKSTILAFFSKQGCTVESVRLVYDQTSSKNWNHRVFKGVAFLDLANEKSYKKALGLHRTWFTVTGDHVSTNKSTNRARINIRPTRTKEELAVIAQKTKERVEQLRKDSLNNKDTETSSRNSNIMKEKRTARKDPTVDASKPSKSGGAKRKREDNIESKQSRKTHKEKQQEGPKKMTPKKSDITPHRRSFHRRRDSDRKLSKKERAKKAAIIRSK
jgi:hypothetical protein